jgi:hypothetical protein
MPETKKTTTRARSASLRPASLDENARTVEVVWATDAPVPAYHYEIGEFLEVLSFEPQHIRSQRLDVGLPILDDHNAYSGTRGVLGVMENYRLEGNQGIGTLRFSKRKSQDDYVGGVFQDVKDDILRTVSARYKVYKYIETNPLRAEGELPILKAIDWEPKEVSMSPIPADPNSRVRSDEAEQIYTEIVTEQIATDNQNNQPIEKNNMAEEVKPNGGEDNIRSLPPTPAPAAAPIVDADQVRKDAEIAERKRSAEILDSVKKTNLGEDFARKLIEDGTPIEQARKLIIDKFAEADPAKGQGTVTVGADETDKRRSAMEDAIILRANPNFQMEESRRSAARDFRGMTMIRMAEEAIHAAGGRTRGLSQREIAVASLGIDDTSVRSAGMHSTSDFPIILGNTINRVLRAEYALAPSTFAPFTRQTTATDFREMTKAQFGEVGNFTEVLEGGEYKNTTLSEAKESYRIKKYGQMITVSWEALINDDLGAFGRIPAKIAAAANRLKSDIIYGILSANPTMGDGVALFHSTHGNLAGTGAAIDLTTLSAGRKAMRLQKGLDKKDFLNISPSFLVVGPEYEQIALQYTSESYLPATQGNINPWKGLLQVIVEPRITGNAWYLMAAPGVVETIEYAYLEGEGELYTETKQGFEVDGVQVKARMTFGAKAIDFRGMYRNAGA